MSQWITPRRCLNAASQFSRSRTQPQRVQLLEADICDIEITNASLVVMNFLPAVYPSRQASGTTGKDLCGAKTGRLFGDFRKACYLSLKSLNQLLCELHHQFKSAQGYSDLEISQKRDSIENVLIPETLDSHINRLKACGFESASPWFQCFNFASLVAIKPV